MKALNTILKVVTALATVAGAIYIVATYGEEIVAWAKRLLSSLPKCPGCEKVEEPAAEDTPVTQTPAAENVPAEAAPVEEPAEEPAPEVVVAENEPVAEEQDFAE